MGSTRDYYERGDVGGNLVEEGEERVSIVRGWCQEVVGDVLDIGCSDGRLGTTLRGVGRRVIGVDLNPSYVAEAATRLDDVRSFDITEQWPFADASIAAVHMGAVIEHVFDFRTLFEETSRTLIPGGRLWISVPNMACLRHRVEVLMGRMPSWYTNFEHIRPWTVAWLDEQVGLVGLSRTRLAGAHIRSTPLHRVLSKLPTLATVFVTEHRKG